MKMHRIPETGSRLFRRHFTLLELVIVIGIIILFSTVIVTNFSIPAFATLDGTSKNIRQIFADARRKTALQGVEVNVFYNSESRELTVTNPPSDELLVETDSFYTDTASDENTQMAGQESYTIPAKIEVQFPDYDEELIRYRFFPDGSASGPEMTLTLGERSVLLGISRLTGMAYSRLGEE